MSAQTISLRLPEEEVAILNLLSDRERRTKTQIIREALQPLFRKVLDEPERITLSNTEFQALLDPKSRSKRSRYSSENDVLIEKSVKYTDFFLLSIVYV